LSSDGLLAAPSRPLYVIRPRRGWVALDLGSLWSHRELLYFLIWRDVKIRYRQTAFGVLWAVLQPLLTMLVFTLLFGRWAGMPSDGLPYSLFALMGVLPWTFFANAVGNASASLVTSAHLIRKVYFPRLLMPAASVGVALVDLFIGMGALAALMAYHRVPLRAGLWLVPLLVALTALLAFGVGTWLAALNVRYRDVRHALPFLIQLWMFATPVIYPSSLVPPHWRPLLALNPLAPLIESYRSVVLGRDVAWGALGLAALLVGAVTLGGLYSFRRMESEFADVI
jgi:lipopolysaccharide transport system permease protein